MINNLYFFAGQIQHRDVLIVFGADTEICIPEVKGFGDKLTSPPGSSDIVLIGHNHTALLF